MKSKISALVGMFLLAFAFTSKAQGSYGQDSLKCLEKLSVFYEFGKAKNYVDAYKPWSWAYNNCPASNKNIFIMGPNIVEGMIEATEDEALKEKYIDTLLMVWKDRNVYFPGQEAYVYGKLGSEIMSYRSKTDFLEGFEVLGKSLELDGNNTSASVLLYYVKAAAYMYNADSLTKLQIIDIYQTVDNIIGYNLKNEDTKDDKYYEKASSGIEKMLGPFLECEDLIKVFTDKYEDLKADPERMSRAANLLEKKECTDSEIFFQLSEELYKINPSAESAYRMGTMAYTRDNYNKAIEYFKAGLELDENTETIAEYSLKIANCYQKLGSREAARTYALKAAKNKSGWGDPYILIGDLYAGTKGCGTNEFEVKTVYWAAIDKYEYARSIDPSVSSTASKRISTYEQYAPDKTLTFQHGKLEAKTVSVGCWINEEATVRVQ